MHKSEFVINTDKKIYAKTVLKTQVGEESVCFLQKDEKITNFTNNSEVVIHVLEGKAKVEFNDGDTSILNKNDCLLICPGIILSVLAIEDSRFRVSIFNKI